MAVGDWFEQTEGGKSHIVKFETSIDGGPPVLHAHCHAAASASWARLGNQDPKPSRRCKSCVRLAAKACAVPEEG